ncbi:histidine kinase [Nostoc linckia]|nr:histidine kinase [Nostoc linckia]
MGRWGDKGDKGDIALFALFAPCPMPNAQCPITND